MNIHFLYRSNLLLACPFVLIIILPKCIIGLHNSFSRTALMTMLRRCRCHYYAVLSLLWSLHWFFYEKKNMKKKFCLGRELGGSCCRITAQMLQFLASLVCVQFLFLREAVFQTRRKHITEKQWKCVDTMAVKSCFCSKSTDNAFCRNTQNVQKINEVDASSPTCRTINAVVSEKVLAWLALTFTCQPAVGSVELEVLTSSVCVTARDDRNALAGPKMYPVSLLCVDHFNMGNCRRHINRDKKSSYRWTFISCSYKTAAQRFGYGCDDDDNKINKTKYHTRCVGSYRFFWLAGWLNVVDDMKKDFSISSHSADSLQLNSHLTLLSQRKKSEESNKKMKTIFFTIICSYVF